MAYIRCGHDGCDERAENECDMCGEIICDGHMGMWISVLEIELTEFKWKHEESVGECLEANVCQCCRKKINDHRIQKVNAQ